MQMHSVRKLEVIVRGQEFVMKEVRKVMIKSYKPESFIQTDKPIYLPGQTGSLFYLIESLLKVELKSIHCNN